MSHTKPVKYEVDLNHGRLFKTSNDTHTERITLKEGLNIENINTLYETPDLQADQTVLADTDIDDREYLASLLPEENKIYFIRITGGKLKCMINYKPNWNCQTCTYQNSHKDKECYVCKTPRPRFRSCRKRSGKTKRSGSCLKKSGAGLHSNYLLRKRSKRLKRSKKSLKKTCNHERNLF